jgi:AbrB family looped-hinge helix DNA binding protein
LRRVAGWQGAATIHLAGLPRHAGGAPLSVTGMTGRWSLKQVQAQFWRSFAVDIFLFFVYTILNNLYMEQAMATSTLSEKGWVVIPQELRQRYGLKKGDRVHIVDYGGVIAIVPASDNPIDTSFGMLKGKSSLLRELTKSRLEDAAREK